MKQDQYFKFEVNLLNDERITLLIYEFGTAEAIGLYTLLLTYLRTSNNYEVSCKPTMLEAFANRYNVNVEHLTRVIYEFDLFEVDEERQMFRSPYLDKAMQQLESRWKVNVENGKKGGRPKRATKTSETPTSKGLKPNENQERRGEEKRNITPVVNNSSNIGAGEKTAAADDSQKDIPDGGKPQKGDRQNETNAVAAQQPRMQIRSAAEQSQRPLQPVKGWEQLVDELAASDSFMELAGLHSGLGKLFADHQPFIIRLFKDHIRLYGKQADLLFAADVQRYFCNYVAAGSTTGRILREKLFVERDRKAAENVFRFEDQDTGMRSYFGHPIPDYAPPRPDASAVWDDKHRVWGR